MKLMQLIQKEKFNRKFFRQFLPASRDVKLAIIMSILCSCFDIVQQNYDITVFCTQKLEDE